MKPRRTPSCNTVYRLEGGNEDNDLWVRKNNDPGYGEPTIVSTWEPTSEERDLIAAGGNVYLRVWGEGQPPVSMGVTRERLGK